MEDIVQYTERIPDEILPPYRKNRQYINNLLSSNEASRAEFPNCKLTFGRFERGVYVIDTSIKWLWIDRQFSQKYMMELSKFRI